MQAIAAMLAWVSTRPSVEKTAAAAVLRALEAARWIERIDHPQYPRAKALTVTRAGRDLARKAVVAVEDADAAFFKPLASDTKRLVAMFQTLVDETDQQ